VYRASGAPLLPQLSVGGSYTHARQGRNRRHLPGRSRPIRRQRCLGTRFLGAHPSPVGGGPC
jgi:hypothetical protein